MKHNILFFLLILLSSCLDVQPDADAPQSPFMDIKGYFEKEMEKEYSNVQKITSIGTEKEIVKIEKLNLKDELKIFSDADISKVAWFEKYDVITKGNCTSYIANDDRLKTRSIEIFKTNDQIDSLLVHSQMHSLILDTDQYLSYYPNQGYKITIDKVGKLQSGNSYSIEVLFKSNLD